MARKISKNRFDAFTLMHKKMSLTLYFTTSEVAYYSSDDDNFVAVIVYDESDDNYQNIFFAKDNYEIFRIIFIDVNISEKKHASDKATNLLDFYQINYNRSDIHDVEPYIGIYLFEDKWKEDKLHHIYKFLRNNPTFISAKMMIVEVSKAFKDIDGNFVKEFQSLDGLDSRVWELYLFAALRSLNFHISRDYERPDFVVKQFGIGEEIMIEAVTVSNQEKRDTPFYYNMTPEDGSKKIKEKNSNFMPLRFGSPLFSKLKKKYWKLPHVSGKPLVIAIADFHEPMSMTWSHPSLTEYLYGLKTIHHYNEAGNLIVRTEQVRDYIKSTGKTVKAGFFNEPDSEHISAVLFSSIGTLSKFTRMGIQAGFKDEKTTVFREGVAHDHNPDASLPKQFAYEVTEQSGETWEEGINIFHNPNASIPLDFKYFAITAQHFYEDGLIKGILPDFHPYWSTNLKMTTRTSVVPLQQ